MLTKLTTIARKLGKILGNAPAGQCHQCRIRVAKDAAMCGDCYEMHIW